MNKTRLRKYAYLIASKGANVKKGQEVFITAELDQPEFVKMVVDECYKAGASKVTVDWTYQPITKSNIKYCSEKLLSILDDWQIEKCDENLAFIFPIEYDYIEFASEGGVFLKKDGYKWHADYDGTVLHPFLCDGTDYLNYPNGYNEEGTCIDVMSPYMTYSLYPHYGIIRRDNGKVIVPAVYSHIRMLSATMFEAQLAEDDEWVLIDVTGKVLGNK